MSCPLCALTPSFLKRVRQESQNQITILKDENALLKQQLAQLRAEKGLKEARSDKYLMFFPTDGPNNQLYGFKVIVFIAVNLSCKYALRRGSNSYRLSIHTTFCLW